VGCGRDGDMVVDDERVRPRNCAECIEAKGVEPDRGRRTRSLPS
jgi:hypothetical protein